MSDDPLLKPGDSPNEKSRYVAESFSSFYRIAYAFYKRSMLKAACCLNMIFLVFKKAD